ncbi:MAG: hypothetical protein IIY93_11405 [Clostridia bacterium]|nr:hypothetical protein [Clostridia bacterium]MBQ1554284.1 hypothetical protein [Clostridia bacterium]
MPRAKKTETAPAAPKKTTTRKTTAVKKLTPKTEEVKTEEVKAEEVKAEEVKAEEVKTEEVKAEEAKVEEVKTEEVKVEAPAAAATAEVFIEFGGAQVPVNEIIANAKAVVGEDKDIKVYVQPENSKAYIAFDDQSVEMDVYFVQ